jgi:hypothetical protein
MNYKEEYVNLFNELIKEWKIDGNLFAITGVISGKLFGRIGLARKIFCQNENELIYFFNRYQREITCARNWKKEKHRQVKVMLFPETNKDLLHFHGILSIPVYVYKKNDIERDAVDINIIKIFEEMYLRQFKKKCEMRRYFDARNKSIWCSYMNKFYSKNIEIFDGSNFLILP